MTDTVYLLSSLASLAHWLATPAGGPPPLAYPVVALGALAARRAFR